MKTFEELSESQIRDIVGAPSIEDEDACLCGKQINECDCLLYTSDAADE